MKRTNYSSGAAWENIVGYSRAVKAGGLIEISGTTSVKGAQVMHKGDAYKQTAEVLKKIASVLEEAGGSLTDVIRTRVYVVNIDDWEEVARAHSEVFREIKPASTMVEVSKLIDPGLLVEIEATAMIKE